MQAAFNRSPLNKGHNRNLLPKHLERALSSRFGHDLPWAHCRAGGGHSTPLLPRTYLALQLQTWSHPGEYQLKKLVCLETEKRNT